VADLGSVALASGTAATLDFNGDGLISFAVTGEVSGVVIASAPDIDVTAPNINANDESFNETRNLILSARPAERFHPPVF